MAMSDEQRAGGAHCRQITDKIRQLARQSDIPQIREELSDLADQLDWMAGLFEEGGVGPAGNGRRPRPRPEHSPGERPSRSQRNR
jgi:hypothetical protein